MIAHIQANYVGCEVKDYNIDGKKYIGRYIGLQNPEKKLQIMTCSYVENLDVSKLVELEQYMFIVDMPISFNDKTRLKVIDVVPFKVDKK